jgi:hypothetical protein
MILATLAGAESGVVGGMSLAVTAVAIRSVVCRRWLEWRGRNASPLTSRVR